MKDNILYHGSPISGLKIIKRSKDGYVYATSLREFTLVFPTVARTCYEYSLGFNNGKWILTERVKGIFNKMYNHSASIYHLNNKNFKKV